MAGALAFLDDIFFQAKIVETAKQAGVDLRICTTSAGLTTQIRSAKPQLIIIDLNARSDPFEAIAQAKAECPDVPVVAFLSHVQTDLAERARTTGCVDVMPRSKFTRDLATILSRAKSHS